MRCPFCNAEHNVAVPTVHLNGTPAKYLYDNLEVALDAVRNAAEKLAAAAPNGRDYYVQDAGAIGRARHQYEARQRALETVQRELEEMLEHVVAVRDFEERRRAR